MSMHEIESLVEMSVYCLHESQDNTLDRRSLFYNLYELQSLFDTGFTHFRVMDILIEHRFVYTFPITAHPSYAQHQAFLDALAASQKFSFIYTRPEQEWDAETNPVAGYAHFDQQKQTYLLYCDAGSPLWTALVANGTLQGPDAVAPAVTDVFSLALVIARNAAQQQYRDLLNSWYLLLPYMVMAAEQENEPINQDALKEILDLVVAQDAIYAEGLPPLDELPNGGELGKFCEWWYAPAKDKMKTAAEMDNGIDLDAVPFTQEVEKTAGWYDSQVTSLLESIHHSISFMEDNGYNEDTQKSVEGRLQLALDYARKGIELAPNEPGLLVNMGSLYLLVQQYEEALACYNKALALAPDNTYVHLNRAILFYHMEDIPMAIASFEKLLTLEPDNEFAQQWLAQLKNNG
ncbi:tetratricopeptide repeat protein [Chitinophaga qingshengii]|uniref:Tetratricopeptide repeat protein n=1 Tax=Chitinophaga qingshengii TaxID=1569794 RepID=A0ABR7TSI1_9BACT|nr:tetratricopeptide repeat protein [Chitinophaga qingshengii]MBC9932354.1 tetratricopeptide repeat protein [Chitinophaga qingshengii]